MSASINTDTKTISQQVMSGLNTRPEAEKKRNGELDQGDFLELMIAQVRHQDPFEPMQNGEFIAQMAQFATVDGIQSMQSSISDLNGTMSSSQALTATNLVGRSVMAPGGEFKLGRDGEVGGSITADGAASVLIMDVFNAAGALVARRELAPSADGVTRFSFDGRDASGSRLPPGNYRIESQALVGGQPAAAEVSLARRIDSVTIGSALADLKLNLDSGAELGFGSVREFL